MTKSDVDDVLGERLTAVRPTASDRDTTVERQYGFSSTSGVAFSLSPP